MRAPRPAVGAGLWARLRLAVAVVAGAALIACGAGGLTAGIEGTGVVSSGAISGFGSVFVNGVEFATTGTSILVNGQAATQSDLRAGQVVNVTGKLSANGTSGSASAIQYDASVRGPVSTVNLAASTFTVLGQTVTVGSTTSLGADTGGAPTVANFVPGSLVEVSGFQGTGGSILAARVDLKTTIASDLLSGTVAGLDAANLQFTLGTAAIDYSAASFDGFPAGRAVAFGDAVQVTSAAGSATGLIHATAVRYIAVVPGAGGSDGAIDGLVTRFASPTDFDVAGTHATTNAATTYVNGAAATIAVGVHLRAEGTFDGSGVLLATQVSFDQSSPVLLLGALQAVTPGANTLQILGVTITTSVDTRFDDDAANPVVPFNLGSLAIGDTVEIRGRTNSAGGVDASLLTRRPPSTTVEVQGVATLAQAPNLSVLGINAVTDSITTTFLAAGGAPITSQMFYAQAAGAVIDLSGTLLGGVLQVQTARLPGNGQVQD